MAGILVAGMGRAALQLKSLSNRTWVVITCLARAAALTSSPFELG